MLNVAGTQFGLVLTLGIVLLGLAKLIVATTAAPPWIRAGPRGIVRRTFSRR
jgi:hypothetical protein